jgi:hypothetical protein
VDLKKIAVPAAWAVLIGLALPACGWRWGTLDTAFSFGRVEGVTVEPGFAEKLSTAFARRTSELGIPSGPRVVLVLLRSATSVEAAGSLGQTVFRSEWKVRAQIPSRPGCIVEVGGREPWYVDERTALSPGNGRDAAYRSLATDLAHRAVDALLANAACAERRGD